MINIVKPLAEEFMSHCQNKYGFAHPPKINFVDDVENAKDPMGRTAHYDPQNKSITLYITNRHPKDILRSLAHELTHHLQNLRGEFDEIGELGEGYAQNNEHMRNMEIEAYASGIDVRDWEDSKNNIQKENISMNNKEIALLRKLVEQQVRKALDAVQKEGIGQHSAKSIGKIPGNYSAQTPDDSKPEGDDDEFSDIDPTIDPEYDASQPMGRDRDFEAAIRRKMQKEGYKGSEYENPPASPDLTPEEEERFRELQKKYREAGIDGRIADPEYRALNKKAVESMDNVNYSFNDGGPPARARRNAERKAELDLERDKEAAGIKETEDAKITTPEQEQTLYEARFTDRDTKLFERLMNKWTK